jgi:5-histidylcysteine sulfoxide synthase
MGLEHERIHFETTSMLIRQLPADALRRPTGWRYAPLEDGEDGEAPSGRLIDVEAGTVELGKPTSVPSFGWDNEYGSRVEQVSSFAATADLVTNDEFLAFVQDGGYDDPSLWSEEGQAWKDGVDARHPKFWVPAGDGYRYRAMFEELEWPAHWPAEVNAHEAQAFCRWRGPEWRLPTEAESVRICQDAPLADADSTSSDTYNLELSYGSPTPVGHLPGGTTGRGFNDVHGNVWQWLSDDFEPLPGFQKHDLYEDFSEPYFDDRHSMLRGGSWASTGTSASRFYRLWFRREFFQHAGFRLARNAGS